MGTLLTVCILSIINGFASIAGAIGNILVCCVLYRNEELQTGVNYFILNLSVADLTVCTIAQPMYVYYLNQEWSAKNFATFKLVSYFPLHFSFSNLLLLTVNRLFAVLYSFRYGTVMRGKNVAVIVCLAWGLSAVLAIVFAESPIQETAPYFHLAMLLTFLTIYLKIFCIAEKKRRQIVSQFESVSHNYRVAKVAQDYLTTRTLAILICVSVVLFLPDLWLQLTGSEDSTRFYWSFTTMFLSSFLNPCVYVWRSGKFRSALYKTFGLSRAKTRLVRRNQVKRIKNIDGVFGSLKVIDLEALEHK